MRARKAQFSLVVVAAAAALMGCSSNSADTTPSESQSGGSGTKASAGGASNQAGGSAAKGGSSSVNSSGGSVSSSNSIAVSSGGTSSGTNSSSNAPNSGGSNSVGGSNASGGRIANSSSVAKGGSSTSASGSVAKAGAPGNGGTTSAGGKSANGGETVGIAGRANNGGRNGNAGGTAANGATAGRTGAAGSGTGGAAGATSGTGTGKVHLFLLLGQSNMAGYPRAQDTDKVKNPRITVLGFDDCPATGRKTDKWDTAVPPLHECSAGAIGPGDWFSKTIIDSLPAEDTIGLIPCAFSGEKIETFLKSGGSHYARIIQRAKLAMETGGKIEGMLFHQGESNCGDSAWPNNVKQMVTDLKGDLGFGDIPFLVGEFSSGSKCTSQNPLISQLPGLISTATVVPAKDLKIDPADTQWTLHFDHTSQVTLGQRYAEAMKTALKW